MLQVYILRCFGSVIQMLQIFYVNAAKRTRMCIYFMHMLHMCYLDVAFSLRDLNVSITMKHMLRCSFIHFR
jgi:molybdenum cofactor biosynthesis enzyme